MIDYELRLGVTAFDGTCVKEETSVVPESMCRLSLKKSLFICEHVKTAESPEAEMHFCSFLARTSDVEHGRFFVRLELEGFQDNWFVFLPSACYNGNRFQMIQSCAYPPLFLKDAPLDNPLHPPVTMRELPSIDNGFNRMITDASAPLIGIFMPDRKISFFLTLEQDTILGNNGVEMGIFENSVFRILLSLPAVRRKSFTACANTDTAPALKNGMSAEIRFRVCCMKSADIATFYQCFARIRSEFPAQGPLKNRRSFSHASGIILEMFENVRWLEKYKFYTKARGQERMDFGWVAYQELSALFENGGTSAREHVLEELKNVFENAPCSNGLFFPVVMVEKDVPRWEPDLLPQKNYPSGGCWVRKQCDILYFSLKMLLLLERHAVPVPAVWREALRNLACALARIWRTYGQFGYIVGGHGPELIIGGSAAGAIAPAALVLAGNFFQDASFQKTAEESARFFCGELKKHGFTCGGPGDALFAPDSESAFSLLESLVLLFEQTKNPFWLSEAEFCADYCASWTPSVKYRFPAGSTFDSMDIDCRGAVQANLQNQHGAPGPCTNSAVALLRLFRFTGKVEYLELLRDIAHNSTQYLSTASHPVPMLNGAPLPCGDICEKVFFQDYGNCCGRIPSFGSGGWTEISVLLCITENPGVYCRKDTGLLVVLDHIEASFEKGVLTLKNIFDYPVEVSILSENAESVKTELGILPFLRYETVRLEPYGVLLKQL